MHSVQIVKGASVLLTCPYVAFPFSRRPFALALRASQLSKSIQRSSKQRNVFTHFAKPFIVKPNLTSLTNTFLDSAHDHLRARQSKGIV